MGLKKDMRRREPRPVMSEEFKGILKTNNLFYKALGTRDLDLMAKVWVHEPHARCVHPGWTALRGWEAIQQSWGNVFDPRDQVDIRLSNVSCEIRGDVAWVTCIQHMTYLNRHPKGANISLATNIFESRSSEWLMVVHHASPLPIVELTDPEKNLQ